MTDRHPLLAWILGWLVPGAGHWYIGQRDRGAVLAGTLVGCFLAGVLLGGRGTVTDAHPEFLALQCGAGLPAAAAWAVSTPDPADVPVSRRDLGMLYTLVPALLNLVVAMDAAARAVGGNPGGEPGAGRTDSPTEATAAPGLPETLPGPEGAPPPPPPSPGAGETP